MLETSNRSCSLPLPFSLAQTCGPVAWTTGRSPRHRWDAGVLTWVGWDCDQVVWRQARQADPARLVIVGNGDVGEDEQWLQSVLGSDISLPVFSDPMMIELANRYPGMRPYCDGSVFEGIVTAIVGQSISVAAAAVTQAKLAALYPNSVEVDGRTMRPLPSTDQLADSDPALVRLSGVTMRRAEALVHAAREARAGNLPDEAWARRHPDGAVRELLKLPLVGRWTAESIVLWGLGAPDAHPTGDVALLRAARQIYGRPNLSHQDVDHLADGWRPARGLAVRLLWTQFFGPAPD
jgi:3-methyladenine DNA glycosylase/8-oxoguanine DNA glycosylase